LNVAAADWEGARKVADPATNQVAGLRELLVKVHSNHASGLFGNSDYVTMDIAEDVCWDPVAASKPEIDTMRESAEFVYRTLDGGAQPAQAAGFLTKILIAEQHRANKKD
jgi:hypothetical protein